MRTPEEIIGADAVLQLNFEGYVVVPAEAVTKAVKRVDHREFEFWWRHYPNKTGKGAAEKSYQKARTLASADVLLDGLHRYAAKRDDRPWCNPATWLNQRRWEDEQPLPTQPPPARGIAGVRQRLAQEIDNGSAPHLGNQGPAGRVPVGLPFPDQRR